MKEENVKRDKKSRNKGFARHAVVIEGQNIKHNYTWLAGFAVVFLMGIICSAVYKTSGRLENKNAEYDRQIVELNEQLTEQEKRKEELDYRAIYITTKQFVEEFAREKLGLIFEDELIFKPEDE